MEAKQSGTGGNPKQPKKDRNSGSEGVPDKNRLLQKEILSRLKKIEGQVRGIQNMIQECRSCGDIVTQIAAVKAAVNRVGLTVLACHLADNIESDLDEGKDVKQTLTEFMTVFKKFS